MSNSFFNMQNYELEKLFLKIKKSNRKKIDSLSGGNLKIQNPKLVFVDKSKWLVNLTDLEIPRDVTDMINLGPKHGLHIKNDFIPMAKLISDFEACTQKIPSELRDQARIDYASKINNFKRNPQVTGTFNREVIISIRDFRLSHPELLFLKADKVNATFCINRNDYLTKMLSQLSDVNTYKIVKHDLVYTLQLRVNNLANAWVQKKFISSQFKRSIYINNSVPARAYGLPKIHKPEVPFRIIVSFINSPTYKLAKTLNSWIKIGLTRPASFIKDSFDLVDIIRGQVLPSNYILVSLDVVSLFTNVPLDLVINAIKKRWDNLKSSIPVPLDQMLTALNICFDASIFKFNDTIYSQTFGLPMGSPLSPILADIVMDDLESCCIKKLPFTLPFYYRYRLN
ncbi:uncharacterized protein LOC124406224 [Diprion similis]|uniref:uncharacterized protein LOC124406224 n=1 Tax=Diprion similis TaxID=362088 RepID=UPI001EF779D5|nr:uncharacterized protein LOC124406224 [Diprion similis]